MNILSRLERNCYELAAIIDDAKAMRRDKFLAYLAGARRSAEKELNRKSDKRFKQDIWASYRGACERGFRGSAEAWYHVVSAGL